MHDYRQRLEKIEKALKPDETIMAILTLEQFARLEKGEIPRPKTGLVVVLPARLPIAGLNRLHDKPPKHGNEHVQQDSPNQ